jgi:hypothetical protein
MPDALQDRVRAESSGELTNAFDGLVAALADNVGGPERTGDRDPIVVATEHDDSLLVENGDNRLVNQRARR